MNRSSARDPRARSRRSLFAVLALAAALGVAGCENDSGKGPEGPSGGDPGQTGPTGPTGPADTPITLGGDVKEVGTGAALTAQQIADIGSLVVSLDAASIAENKPVIEITVKTAHGGNVLGLAASTLRLGVAKLVPGTATEPSRWQSYINRNAAAAGVDTPALASAIQANTESGVASGWTELGAGRYRYVSTVDLANVTSPIAVPYEPTLTHRISIALDLSGGARALAPDNPYFDFVPAGGTAASKRIAATEKCASCHVRFAVHGGPRRNVEYCVVCHNDATIDPESGESVDMAYMAHSIHRGEARTQNYVIYGYGGTKYDFGEVTYPQPLSFCESCHEQSATTPQGNAWNTTVSIGACAGCHDAGMSKTGPDAATGRYTYAYEHTNAIVPPGFVFKDGECIGCHGANSVTGDNLSLHKRETRRKQIEQGDLFKYEIVKVENAAVGQSPKVTFRILDANGTPIDVKSLTTGRLRLDFAWSTKDIHNLGTDAEHYMYPRGEALVYDLITYMSDVVANGDGTFSYTLPITLPATFADATLGSGLMVVLEGRRQMTDGSYAYPESAIGYSGSPRKTLVSQEKCEACHKRVAAHGGSRAGDPLVCAVCHNSSLGGTWDGEDLGSLALGAMIHNLHAGNLGNVTYPQSLARCEGCHLEGTYNVARTEALPLTVDQGTLTVRMTDDLADSATAGTCKGCHTSSGAIAHMQSQGGSFAQPKTMTPSSSQEGCAMCHAAGRTFDTKAAHCGVLPYGQCTN